MSVDFTKEELDVIKRDLEWMRKVADHHLLNKSEDPNREAIINRLAARNSVLKKIEKELK